MKLRFWGVRGSIATPGPSTARTGGNTTCLEVRGDDGTLIILDGGTGIHPLALSLLRELPVKAHIFVSHTHWDHIQGLPFFIPIFIPGNEITIHGPIDPVSNQGIEQVMAVQMQYSYFPVREAELKAQLNYRSLIPGETVTIGEVSITPILLNHPVINYGYKIECRGKSLFFTGDHEPHQNIYAPEDEGYAFFQSMIEEKENAIAEALSGVQVLIADTSYTDAEYPAKKGWGHGSFGASIRFAHRIGAQTLFCTHHEPTRSDDALEKAFSEAMQQHAELAKGMDVRLAREGEGLDW